MRLAGGLHRSSSGSHKPSGDSRPRFRDTLGTALDGSRRWRSFWMRHPDAHARRHRRRGSRRDGDWRSLLRHPRLAQALDQPVPHFEIARIGLWTGELSFERLPRRDCSGSVGRECKVALEGFAGLRRMTGKRERRDEVSMRPWIFIRADRDRLPGEIYRLVVLLQGEIGIRFNS